MSQMYYIFLLFFIRACLTFDLPHNACAPNVTIENDHYNVSDTYQVLDAFPTDAHYDEYGNLFFVETGRNSGGYCFNVKIIKANTTEALNIPGLPPDESYSVAVSKKDSKVYFGTSEGIFEYNYDMSDATLISKPGMKINMIFVDKDGNKYISESPDGIEELYLLAGDKKIRYRSLEALNEMAVDDENNFYFIKEKKLFVLKSDSSGPKFMGNITYEGYAQISFHKEIVFIASETLAYIHENDTGPLKLIKNLPGKVTAIAFDSNGNFILGVHGKILKYTNMNLCYHRNNA